MFKKRLSEDDLMNIANQAVLQMPFAAYAARPAPIYIALEGQYKVENARAVLLEMQRCAAKESGISYKDARNILQLFAAGQLARYAALRAEDAITRAEFEHQVALQAMLVLEQQFRSNIVDMLLAPYE